MGCSAPLFYLLLFGANVNPISVSIMGLFNFSAPSNNNNSGQEIDLIINDERITVSAAEAAGSSVADLFKRFASGAADLTRINRYVAQGRIVAGDSTAEPGTVYTAAIASETKGAA